MALGASRGTSTKSEHFFLFFFFLSFLFSLPLNIFYRFLFSLAIDTSLNTLDLIELFLHKNRMEKLKKSDFLLYLIRVDASNHIIFERPLDGADIPLAIMAMTGGLEEPCRFLLVELEMVSPPFLPLGF